jgi:hypothetical protein
MRRLCLALLLAVLFPLTARAANTHGGADEASERAAWFGALAGPYVASGCLWTVPVSSLTLGAQACSAYVRGASGELVYVTQTAQAVGPLSGGDGTYWVALARDLSSPVSGWTRQAGTHYLWQRAATFPGDPTGGLVVGQVTVASSVISQVFLDGDRVWTTSATLSASYTTTTRARWWWRSGALLTVASGQTLTLPQCPTWEGPRQLWSANGSSTGVVRFGAAGQAAGVTSCLEIYPEWWGASNQSDTTVDSAPAIQQAANACATANMVQGVVAARSTLRFQAGVYVVHNTLTWGPYCNYRGVRATVTITSSSYTCVDNCVGTTIRGHTDIPTSVGVQVLIFMYVGDISIRDITFANWGSGVAIGWQLSNSSSGRAHEAGKPNGGMCGLEAQTVRIDGFNLAIEENAGCEMYLKNVGFESNTTAIQLGSASVTYNALAELECEGCIVFASGRGVVFSDKPAANTLAIQARFLGGIFLGSGTANAETHISYGPVTRAPTSVDFMLNGTRLEHVAGQPNKSHITFAGLQDSSTQSWGIRNTTILNSGSTITRGAGTAVPGLSFQNNIFNTSDLTLGLTDRMVLTGNVFNGGKLGVTNVSTNALVVGNTWRDNAGIGIDISVANCGGWLISQNYFSSVTTPVNIFNNATNDTIQVLDNVGVGGLGVRGIWRAQSAIPFANLSTPANGSLAWCNDCTKATPCAGAGGGAFARRAGGAWDCN